MTNIDAIVQAVKEAARAADALVFEYLARLGYASKLVV